MGGGGWVVDLDYNVSSLPNFLFSFFGFRFRRELDNYNNDWISPKAVTGYDTCGLCDPSGTA